MNFIVKNTASNLQIAFFLFVGTFPNIACSEILNIDKFLEACPNEDKAFSTIINDFKIFNNDIEVVNFECTSPVSSMPVENYTDELIVMQGLRTIYHMDQGLENHLPWTNGTLYDWMKTKIRGIILSSQTQYSWCCDEIEGEKYLVIKKQNEHNREFDKRWRGISGNISLYTHETRHVDGYYHSSCCGIPSGCDQNFIEGDLPAYGTQWWLEKLWLSGEVNVGIGCLRNLRRKEIGDWHMSSLNGFRDRFCSSFPPEIIRPNNVGGSCQEITKPPKPPGGSSQTPNSKYIPSLILLKE